MGCGLLLRRQLTSRGRLSHQAPQSPVTYAVLAILSDCCPPSKGRLPTCYSPVRRFTQEPKLPFSLDLHVLGLPLTFALSQDQTLHLYFVDDVSSDFIPTRRVGPKPKVTVRRSESGFACWHKTHNSSRYSVFKDRLLALASRGY